MVKKLCIYLLSITWHNTACGQMTMDTHAFYEKSFQSITHHLQRAAQNPKGCRDNHRETWSESLLCEFPMQCSRLNGSAVIHFWTPFNPAIKSKRSANSVQLFPTWQQKYMVKLKKSKIASSFLLRLQAPWCKDSSVCCRLIFKRHIFQN